LLLDMVVEVEHRFAAAPEQVFTMLSDVEAMAGLGPEHEQATWTDTSRTNLRGYVEQHPDRAEQAIAGRAEMLRANMLTVLAAADARLRSGRP
jgi:hypothetical protein